MIYSLRMSETDRLKNCNFGGGARLRNITALTQDVILEEQGSDNEKRQSIKETIRNFGKSHAKV